MFDTLPAAVFAPCSHLFDQVDSAFLDCISDDLALLLAAHGVPDVRAPFAQDWRFDLAESAGDLPRMELPPPDLDRLLAARTGFEVQWRPTPSVRAALPEWRNALRCGVPVLLTGDAYLMPWLPYHQQAHMHHGFVLEGLDVGQDPLAHVADPYDNATEWGISRPIATRIVLSDLSPALRGGQWATLSRIGAAQSPNLQVCLNRNAADITTAVRDGRYDRFILAHQGGGVAELENLALQTWLLARSRGLHARWLSDVSSSLDGIGAGDLLHTFSTEIVPAWQRAAQLAYLALRRVRHGRPMLPGLPQALTDAAAAEAACAAILTAGLATVMAGAATPLTAMAERQAVLCSSTKRYWRLPASMRTGPRSSIRPDGRSATANWRAVCARWPRSSSSARARRTGSRLSRPNPRQA